MLPPDLQRLKHIRYYCVEIQKQSSAMGMHSRCLTRMRTIRDQFCVLFYRLGS